MIKPGTRHEISHPNNNSLINSTAFWIRHLKKREHFVQEHRKADRFGNNNYLNLRAVCPSIRFNVWLAFIRNGAVQLTGGRNLSSFIVLPNCNY